MYRVLTIGPDYKTLKGGIASVLSVYAKYDKSFKFLPTYSSENNFKNILLFPIKYFNILFFLIIHSNYKIIHIHGASRISFYRKYFIFLSLKYLLRRKVIYHIHGGEYHLFENESNSLVKKMIHNMVEQSNAIICLSREWKGFFETKFNPQKTIVLNNIIPMPIKKNKTTNSGTIQFLFLGKIVDGKGIFDLINMAYNHKDYLNDKVKIIIGGNGEVDYLQSKIKRMNIGNIIRYVGWVSGSKKDDLLIDSDVYILPSYNEGLPISILEAMSYKMPIIATAVGGIPRIVQNNVNGILIQPGDQEALFERIKYFTENREKIKAYGQASFEIVKDFLPEKVIGDLHNIYANVLKD
ncbi:conserved membrane hypothetical protein [Sulfurovum sp. enrichment culture clone C5]|uniref:Glycosyl transferase family 1 domain-containing protein n=1 Tax=Sulfurovum sp. enrichment culture clone C5 TaxID=497650 RepID=A0A0S4XQ78_9BACT|nr:conserved membrane hypothetical protein [Sulfurovum sp. enrichment culture clone C5]